MSKAKEKKTTKEKEVAENLVVEKDKKDLKAQLLTYTEKTHDVISKYLLLFAVAISSFTIIGALLLSQHYINPERDEQIYNDGESQISFKEIDKDKLKTLEDSLEDTSVEVETEFVPNRKNPFSE